MSKSCITSADHVFGWLRWMLVHESGPILLRPTCLNNSIHFAHSIQYYVPDGMARYSTFIVPLPEPEQMPSKCSPLTRSQFLLELHKSCTPWAGVQLRATEVVFQEAFVAMKINSAPRLVDVSDLPSVKPIFE